MMKYNTNSQTPVPNVGTCRYTLLVGSGGYCHAYYYYLLFRRIGDKSYNQVVTIKTGTTQGQNRDKTGTKQGQNRDKTGTEQGQNRDKTGTKQGIEKY